ncbi:MAG TPA: substrate-binding domain-containing protein [Xanthobacteraceae bacterium]|nr:substrate-binding domain-containing protein [Xanthobacteraceae bacterium]
MNIRRAIAAAIGFLAIPLLALQVQAADLKVLSSTALKTVLEELGPQFEKATENKVSFAFDPAAVVKTQIDQGAGFDVAIVTVPLSDALVAAGKIDGATRAIVARGGLGVAMRAGAPKPDVSTAEAFKHTLLNAKSIGFNGQGASRAATEAVFVKLGIAEELKPKIKLLQTTASEAVVKDDVEVGLGPISEILASPGAELVGAFPSDLQWYLVLTAGVSTASKNADAAIALIKFLTAPGTVPVLKAKGMEPG